MSRGDSQMQKQNEASVETQSYLLTAALRQERVVTGARRGYEGLRRMRHDEFGLIRIAVSRMTSTRSSKRSLRHPRKKETRAPECAGRV